MENRRSLLDEDYDVTPTHEQRNVFDDEFEVDDFDGVVDGYRPGQSRDREGRRQDLEEEEPVREGSAQYATGTIIADSMSRSSMRKSMGRENPFASAEDEEERPLQRTPSGNFATAIAHRSVSSASSSNYAGTNSPRFGVGGPSHPYAMYPQGTVARTPSAATASTSRPTRQSSSRYAPGPQHPYTLYPQGVDGDADDDDDEIVQNPVPVGFLGLSQPFQRRRGPDGEEQDILGEYGHAEQLPPYTRYPEDGPEKAPLLAVPAPPTALHSRAPVLGTDPSMPLMHDYLQPAPVQQSMTDESDLQRQNSILSRHTRNWDATDDDAESSLLSKKSWSEKSWSERRRTRFCGVPFWVMVALIGVIAFAGAILGGALGGFVAGQRQGSKKALSKVASSTLYDASLITTSTGVPPATGTFPLSLGLPQETTSACLTDAGDQAAWSCDIAGSDQIWIDITLSPSGNETGASLFTQPGLSPSNQLSYGTQASSMFTSFAPFMFVNDNDDPEDGPAFYFQEEYNKLVVVPSDMMDLNARKIKREAYGTLPEWFIQKQYATPGDKPWFCYWNNTLLEAFIYKNQPAEIAPTPTASASSSPTSPSSTITKSASMTSGTTAPLPTAPWSITWAEPAETITTTVSMSSTSCTYSGIASHFPSWMNDNYPDWSPGSVGPGSAPPTKQKRSNDSSSPDDDDDDDDAEDRLVFEYLVKIEERRLLNSPAPLCVQYQVLDNYEWNVVTDANGEQVTLTLAETVPGYAAYNGPGEVDGRDDDDAEVGSKRWLERRVAKRLDRRMITGGCHCQWMSGE